MKKIPLTQGKYALVDNADFEKVSVLKWHFDRGYAVYKNNRTTGKVYMHRFILNTKIGKYCDHKNRKGLDNRRNNLRICTQSENIYNAKIHKDNTSGFKGVSWHKINRKWTAYITHKWKRIYLGSYHNKIDAAKAYNKKIREICPIPVLLNKI